MKKGIIHNSALLFITARRSAVLNRLFNNTPPFPGSGQSHIAAVPNSAPGLAGYKRPI